jgi:hypothetical protein
MMPWVNAPEGGQAELFIPAETRQQDVRVGVGSVDGPRSGVWRFFTGPKGDLYVGERGSMTEIKISLHQSGERMLAYTQGTASKYRLDEHGGRRLLVWEPPEVAPGWMQEMAIWIPASDVTTTARPKGNKAIEWLAVPPSGSVVILRVLTAHPDRGGIRFPQQGPMRLCGLWLNRENGPEACIVTATEHALTPGQQEMLDMSRNDDPSLTEAERMRRHALGWRVWMLAKVEGVPRLFDLAYVPQ